MTNGEFYKVTFDEVINMEPCDRYTENANLKLKEVFADRTVLVLNDILQLNIHILDKVWIMERLLSNYDLAKLKLVFINKLKHLIKDLRPPYRENVQRLERYIDYPIDIMTYSMDKSHSGLSLTLETVRPYTTKLYYTYAEFAVTKRTLKPTIACVHLTFVYYNMYHNKTKSCSNDLEPYLVDLIGYANEEHVDVADKILRRQAEISSLDH